MNLEQMLYQAAIELIEKRYPTGWGGAAAMYTDKGSILTSIAPEIVNASTELCFETGAICEAHKINERITHTVSVIRDNFRGDDNFEYKVLTPCGVCQERLFYWGGEVRCAIYTAQEEIVFKTLNEIQPYYWRRAYEKQ